MCGHNKPENDTGLGLKGPGRLGPTKSFFPVMKNL